MLGIAEFPWQLTVSVRNGSGHPANVLSGDLMVDCKDGWFNFTDLAFSHMGSGYILDFNVTYPPEAVNFTLSSEAFDVPGRPLKVELYQNTSFGVFKDDTFTITLALHDDVTGENITEIAWRV